MGHNKEKYEDQITLFALGLLKGYELRQLEEHLDTGCEICEQLIRENELALNSIAYSLEDSPLDPGIETKIFDKIEAQESTASNSTKVGFWNSIKPIWLNLGSAVAEVLCSFKNSAILIKCGIKDNYPKGGDYKYLLNMLNLDKSSIYDKILKLIKE